MLRLRGDQLQAGDLIYKYRTSEPSRLLEKVFESDDARYFDFITWSQSRYNNVERIQYSRDALYNVKRYPSLKAVPEEIAGKWRALKMQQRQPVMS
jgi:hypothetical protein